jgi:hypothetical protein
MIERLNETNTISDDQVAPRELRAGWERPEVRKLNVGEAEFSVAGSADVSTVFS